MQKFPLLVLTVLMYCDSSYSYQHEYVEDQIIWLDHGEVCKSEYSPGCHCVHFSFCLPTGYTEPKGHAEFCDYCYGYKRMCCVPNSYVPYNPLDTYDPYIYNIPSSEIQQPSIPGGNGNTGHNLVGTHEPYIYDIPNSGIQQPNIGNAENRQEGGNGNTGPVGPGSQGSVAGNVTINLPFVPPTPENSISLKKCKDYFGPPPPPPPGVQFVLEGRSALVGEFPHMALLGYGPPNNIQWKCGGSLISVRYVLTAAHCRFFRPYGEVKFVRLGALNRNPITDESQIKTVGVEAFIRHPSYSFRAKYHDIALIRLNQTIFWNDRIYPACLATRWELDNINMTVTGWGVTEYLGDEADVLQAGDLRYVPNDRCRITYGTRNDYIEGILKTLHICAEGVAEKTDACSGDSGGPLQFNNTFYDFMFVEIAGVVAFGDRCGKVPGVYTRVLPYIPWIEPIVWPNERL